MPEEMIITVAYKISKEKGGLDVIDTLGTKYIVSPKNALIAEKLVVGRASKISVAPTSYGKYINSAELFDGKPPEEKQVEPITAGVEGKLKPQSEPISGPEQGLWVKEVGEWLRKWADKEPVSDESKGIKEAVRLWYFAEMKRVLGITIKKGV